MLSINTNISSLVAQRSLNNSTQLLNQAIERMSTGFKINHASDNAANYSISTNMTTKIGAYQVAEDNVASGLDLLSTANGSLELISSKLSRLRALAEQSANGTYGEKSLDAMNTEASTIINEIQRTYSTAEYNGIKLTSGYEGPDMNRLRVNDNGFIQNIIKRDTNSMASLSSVDENTVLQKGTYSISSHEELAKLARMQNSGKIASGSEFVLGADIDLSSYSNWTPIGWENGVVETSLAFSGTFDGNGYKIRNLTCNQSSSSEAGLFGTIGNSVFKNVGIENANISAKQMGSLAATVTQNSNLTVTNCYIDNVSIRGNGIGGNAGGIIGAGADINSEITSCYANNVVMRNISWKYIGGIIGMSGDIIAKDCFSFFDFQSSFSYSGGVIGIYSNGLIENCYGKGKSIGYGDIGQCGQGGVVAGGDGLIKNCCFEGSLSGGVSIGSISGGCRGNNPLYIENCSAKADIKGENLIGGIVGWQDCKGGVTKNCQFNGTLSLTSSSGSLGSIVGGGIEDLLTVRDCTYSQGTTGVLPAIGDGLGTNNNVKGINTKITLQVGINSDKNSQIEFGILTDLEELMELAFIGIHSDKAFEIIDNLSLKISSLQTEYGAVQNRLDSALDEISTQHENLISSRSTLRDADIAEVSSEYIKQQILQQASATLMATANQSPALALQLL